MAGVHAKLSPSSAEKWMNCPGAVAMEHGRPDDRSVFSDEGTAAHFLAAHCLEHNDIPVGHLTKRIQVTDDFVGFVGNDEDGGRIFTVDMDMCAAVNTYVQAVRRQALSQDVLMVEQRLPISSLTGEEGAGGTADAIVFKAGGELQIHDLKYGMGVRVEAENNKQLMIYAIAALDEYADLAEFTGVKLFIHMPRLHYVSEWAVSLDDLLVFAKEVRTRAKDAMIAFEYRDNWKGTQNLQYLVPGEDQCRWCKAKADCPALAKFVTDTVGAQFEDLSGSEVLVTEVGTPSDALAAKMNAVGLIEDWCKAVRAETERRLFEGVAVPGYKLVQGKRGARQWTNEDEAAKLLEKFRLKVEERYNLKVISPTQAEKIFGEKGLHPSPVRWKQVEALITQKDGSPSVAPESDKRPALVLNPGKDFADETGEDMA